MASLRATTNDTHTAEPSPYISYELTPYLMELSFVQEELSYQALEYFSTLSETILNDILFSSIDSEEIDTVNDFASDDIVGKKGLPMTRVSLSSVGVNQSLVNMPRTKSISDPDSTNHRDHRDSNEMEMIESTTSTTSINNITLRTLHITMLQKLTFLESPELISFDEFSLHTESENLIENQEFVKSYIRTVQDEIEIIMSLHQKGSNALFSALTGNHSTVSDSLINEEFKYIEEIKFLNFLGEEGTENNILFTPSENTFPATNAASVIDELGEQYSKLTLDQIAYVIFFSFIGIMSVSYCIYTCFLCGARDDEKQDKDANRQMDFNDAMTDDQSTIYTGSLASLDIGSSHCNAFQLLQKYEKVMTEYNELLELHEQEKLRNQSTADDSSQHTLNTHNTNEEHRRSTMGNYCHFLLNYYTRSMRSDNVVLEDELRTKYIDLMELYHSILEKTKNDEEAQQVIQLKQSELEQKHESIVSKASSSSTTGPVRVDPLSTVSEEV